MPALYFLLKKIGSVIFQLQFLLHLRKHLRLFFRALFLVVIFTPSVLTFIDVLSFTSPEIAVVSVVIVLCYIFGQLTN